MPSCTYCGAEDSVREECIGVHDQLLCQECGRVQDDSPIIIEEGGGSQAVRWDGEDFSTVQHELRAYPHAKRTFSKWKTKMQRMCRLLELPSAVTEKACSELMTIFNSPGRMKQPYLPACIVAAARNSGCTVGIREVAHAAGVPEKVVYRACARLQHRLEEFRVQNPDVPKMCANLVDQLSRRFGLTIQQAQHAKRLTEICDEQLLGSGRRPQIRCLACLVVLFQSMGWKVSKVEKVLREECETTAPFLRRIMRMTVDLKKVLMKMGEALPWSRGPMKEREMFDKLPDILQFSFSLTNKAAERNNSGTLIFNYVAPHPSRKGERRRLRVEHSIDRLFKHLLANHRHEQPFAAQTSVSADHLLTDMQVKEGGSLESTVTCERSTDDERLSHQDARPHRNQVDELAAMSGVAVGSDNHLDGLAVSFDDCSSVCSLDDEERWVLERFRKGETKDDILNSDGPVSAYSGDLDAYGDRCELDDDDIDEDELNDYIRSPTEVKQVKKLHAD